jgi:hypothetical protein
MPYRAGEIIDFEIEKSVLDGDLDARKELQRKKFLLPQKLFPLNPVQH